MEKKTKTIIQGAAISVICIGLGITTGYLIKKYTTPVFIDYDSMNISPYLADSKKIIEKYNEAKEKGDFSSLDATELINSSIYLFQKSENSVIYLKGAAKASIATQCIRTCTIRNSSNYFEENISKSSLVSVASRNYQKNNTINHYEGTAKEEEIGDYNSEYKTYSLLDYQNLYGNALNEPLIYIVSKKTIKEESIKKEDDKFHINVELEPIYSVYYYVRKMKNLSNLKTYPTFSKVNLDFILDSSLNILSMKVIEKYYALANMGIGTDLDSTINYKFKKDTYLKIPELNEPIIYETEEIF